MFSVAKILCPVDFSPASDLALEAGVRAAVALGSEFYLLHVLEGPAPPEDGPIDASRADAARDAIRQRLAALVEQRLEPDRLHVLVTDGSPSEEILRTEELFGIDLIVLAPHGRPTLGRIIFGSVADKVTRGSRGHVLLVKGYQLEAPSDEPVP